jgi:hypothetical protein
VLREGWIWRERQSRESSKRNEGFRKTEFVHKDLPFDLAARSLIAGAHASKECSWSANC